MPSRLVLASALAAFLTGGAAIGLTAGPASSAVVTPPPVLRRLDLSAANRRAPLGGLPDWSKAGYRGGQPLPDNSDVNPSAACQITPAVLASTYGVIPSDGKDDTDGLQAAIDKIKSSCSPGGSYTKLSLITFPAGVLNVSHEITVDANYLILRGAGNDPATGTSFEYRPDANTQYDTITADGSVWDEDNMTSGDGTGGWLWPGRGLFRVQSRTVDPSYLSEWQAAPANRKDIFQGTINDHWKAVTIDKPLEYDMPVDSTSDGSAPIDGSVYASQASPLVEPVVGVGFENFYLTQPMANLSQADSVQNCGNMDPAAAMHGIIFKWAVNDWVTGIRTYLTGSHPIGTEEAKNLQIQNNYLDGSWNKGAGGNGYFRGSRVWDSLYADNVTRNLRHFTFQWSASDNVAIGNDIDSDFNLHGGYERRNLIELNTNAVPYDHRSGNCSSNCGDDGGSSAPDNSNWFPIYHADHFTDDPASDNVAREVL